MSTIPAMTNSSFNSTYGIYGQVPTPPTDTSPEQQSILSYPTIVPYLDLNFAIAILFVWSAGLLAFAAFAISRITRYAALRKAVPIVLDDKGKAMPYHSTTGKVLGWPGMMMRKLALISFKHGGIPSLGTIMTLVGWMGVIVLAMLWHELPRLGLEGMAYRLPYVGMASLMILFVAAFKDSPLAWAGLSYERINAFHRWLGRIIVGIFLAHGVMIGYLQCVRQGTPFKVWLGRSDVRTGYIAFIFLFLLLVLYQSPIFRRSHIVLTLGFLLTAYYHQHQTILPIFILLAVLALQWLFRLFKMFLPIPKATPQILPRKVTRLTIPLPTHPLSRQLWKSWSPGSHVRITIPAIGLLQPHPFTIASLPSDKELRLYIRSRGGFSQLLYEKTAGSIIAGQQPSLKINFEGLYQPKFPSFAKFEVVLMISSGIGITFCITILKDIVQKVKEIQARDGTCRCKRIGFVWVAKHRGPILPPASTQLTAVELTWFAKELSEIMEQAFGLVALRLYVTQDEPPPSRDQAEKDKDGIPTNILPFLRSGRPNLTGLVEQAVDEAVNMGRLGVATCGNREVNREVKRACRDNLSKDTQDIYCHAEEFDY